MEMSFDTPLFEKKLLAIHSMCATQFENINY